MAGEAEPHGAAGKNLIPHSGSYQGNNLSWRILHLASHRAGAGADATLDTRQDMFTARGSRYFFHEGIHIQFNINKKVRDQQT